MSQSCLSCCICCKDIVNKIQTKANRTQCSMVIGCPPSIKFYDTMPWDPLIDNIQYKNKLVDKILFLGIGSSGKSTLLKSINVQHNIDSNINCIIEECCRFIRSNCVQAMLKLLQYSQILYQFYVDHAEMADEKHDDLNRYNRHIHPTNKDLLKCYIDINNANSDILQDIKTIVGFQTHTFEDDLNAEAMVQLGQSIERIWKLDAIQQTFKFSKQSTFALIDNIDFFLDKVQEIMTENWLPTREDILKARVRTTGLIEYSLNHKSNSFVLFDCGGQRGERRKWIALFERTSCVIYTAALSDFCRVLFEDERQNGLLECMQLFEEVCSWKYFKKTDIVLLFTKTDIFRESLRISSLKTCFGNEYKGRNFNDTFMQAEDLETNLKVIHCLMLRLFDDDKKMGIPRDIVTVLSLYVDLSNWWLNICYDDALQYIKQKFLSLNKDPNKIIHTFQVSAIIPDHVNNIMDQIYDIIIQSNLYQVN